MKTKAIFTLGIIVGILFLFLFFSAAYTVDMTEQVILTQFGRPVGDPVSTPGIHFKMPFIQDVHFFEKRIMEWDSEKREIPTKEKRYIQVDSTARWRICDPLSRGVNAQNSQHPTATMESASRPPRTVRRIRRRRSGRRIPYCVSIAASTSSAVSNRSSGCLASRRRARLDRCGSASSLIIRGSGGSLCRI
ncbi:MAG: hypothetical protein KJ645_05480, partial [Planctomycetes bacterium]|nr:hypothetical protein [Planctomycetota bacterium]